MKLLDCLHQNFQLKTRGCKSSVNIAKIFSAVQKNRQSMKEIQSRYFRIYFFHISQIYSKYSHRTSFYVSVPKDNKPSKFKVMFSDIYSRYNSKKGEIKIMSTSYPLFRKLNHSHRLSGVCIYSQFLFVLDCTVKPRYAAIFRTWQILLSYRFWRYIEVG